MKKIASLKFLVLFTSIIMLSSSVQGDVSKPSNSNAPKPAEIQKLTPQDELNDINTRIKKLQVQRDKFQNRADFAGREANRLLFIDYVSYRMYSIEEETFNNKIRQIDEELKTLNKRKEELEKLLR